MANDEHIQVVEDVEEASSDVISRPCNGQSMRHCEAEASIETSRGWFKSLFRTRRRDQSDRARGDNSKGEKTQNMRQNQADKNRKSARRHANNNAATNSRLDGLESFEEESRFSWKSFKKSFRRLRSRSQRTSSVDSVDSNITVDVEGHRQEDSPVLPRANVDEEQANAGAAGYPWDHIVLHSNSEDGVTRETIAHLDRQYCIPRMISKVINCPWYWGNIDRFDAAAALQTKVDGFFLLRKSAHPEFLFTISFKRFNKTMHVRIESGYDTPDSSDSYEETIFLPWIAAGKFSPTYTRLLELIDHCCEPYEGNICDMPLLVCPLKRKNPFTLKELARATIYETCHYSDIDSLQVPQELKIFIKEYGFRPKNRLNKRDPDL